MSHPPGIRFKAVPRPPSHLKKKKSKTGHSKLSKKVTANGVCIRDPIPPTCFMKTQNMCKALPARDTRALRERVLSGTNICKRWLRGIVLRCLEFINTSDAQIN